MFGWFKKSSRPHIDFDAPLSPEADKFLANATAEFNHKQESLHRDWRFGEMAEWSYDQSTGILNLNFPDGAGVAANGQILGSF